MKKIAIAAALTAIITLSACGGKSEASREQISQGKEKAKEMLQNAKAKPAATAVQPAATQLPDTLNDK